MIGADAQALLTVWRERLKNARTRHQAATAAVQTARELQSHIPSPDGSFVLTQALRAEYHALAEFKRVLIIFNDLVVHEKVPEEEE